MKTWKMIISCLLLLSGSVLYAEMPVWFIPLRDAVIGQELSISEVLPVYAVTKAQAEAIPSKIDRLIMLARCENLMGQVYERERNTSEAAVYYKRGESLSKSAVKLQTTSGSLYVLAESIALQCNVKGLGYQMANGMRFLSITNRAINRDPNNYEALYLLAACYAFPNPPFRNLNMARRYLDDILAHDTDNLPEDIRFKTYYAMGVVCQNQKNPHDARGWFTKALALYPANKDVQQRLGEI